MNPDSNGKRILLIDHQSYWRKISVDALKKFGFTVDAYETYNYLPSQKRVEDKHHDLIVLGCAHIGKEEQQFIDNVLACKHHLLVLCTSLSWQTMRMLFLQGVDDIQDKPYNPANLVKIVNQVLARTPHALAIKQ